MENLIVFICFMGAAALLALFAQGTMLLLAKAGLRPTLRRLIPWILWAATVASVVLVTVFVAFGDLFRSETRGGPFFGIAERGARAPVAAPERKPARAAGADAQREHPLFFETGEGGEPMPARAVKEGTTVVLPDPPAQKGLRFAGWYADRERTVPVSEVRVDGAVTVYAGWLPAQNAAEHRAYMRCDANGDFRPEEGLSRAETLVMLARLPEEPPAPVPETGRFADVREGAWYAEVLYTMVRSGITEGYPGGEFRPERDISRAEFVSVCIRLAEKKEAAEASAGAARGAPARSFEAAQKILPCVPEGHWARPLIKDAAERGWLDACARGGPAFLPDEPVTRAEAATVLNRMLMRRADEAYIRSRGIKGFRDVPRGHWAYPDIMEAALSHGFAVENGEEIWKPLPEETAP
jgi:uncharacterized repeat protein (TIGR02543 family)